LVKWAKYCNKFYDLWVIKDSAVENKKLTPVELLEQSREELARARNLLSRVEDPEMVDYAVLSLKAAEIRYDYLLKQVKQSWPKSR
jgi:hypothetical protein